jgi:alanine racemase
MTRSEPSPSGATAGPQLTIDLAAVASNTRLLADLAAGQLMAVVKADGFGHGASAVARVALANGASWLGVTSLEEALALRASQLRAPVLSWLNPVDADFERAVRQRVDIAIPSFAHLEAVGTAAAQTGQPARVHLHIDLGMARDGLPPSDWPELCRRARGLQQRGLMRVFGVMGHLGWADDPSDPCNAVARRDFLDAVTVARRHGLRPSLRHLAATAATLTDPASHLDLCRVGAGLVGIDPSRTTRLKPVMTLTAPVVAVRDVAEGTSVGYGHTYRTPQPTRLVTLPLGYADGIPRAASGRASVQLRGARCPVVGLVSMDQVVIDVGDQPVEVGEVATVFGPGDHDEPTVSDWARWAMTIEHEIVTGIGSRVSRRVHNPDHVVSGPTGNGRVRPAQLSPSATRRASGRLRALAARHEVMA